MILQVVWSRVVLGSLSDTEENVVREIAVLLILVLLVAVVVSAQLQIDFFPVNFLCKLNSWFVAIHHVQVFPTQTKHLLAITVRQHGIFKLKAYIINSKVMKQKSIKDLCKYKNVNRIILDKNKKYKK